MKINYSKLDNETQLEIDKIIYGCCAIDKHGKRIDVSKCRISKDNNLIYYFEENKEPKIIEAIIKISYK
jgi:hypothetical protein